MSAVIWKRRVLLAVALASLSFGAAAQEVKEIRVALQKGACWQLPNSWQVLEEEFETARHQRQMGMNLPTAILCSKP